MNILFFSNMCEPSKYLIKLMQDEKLDRFFQSICVDNNPLIPQEIKFTPTIIIKGSGEQLVSGACFIWLTKIKQWKHNIMIQRASSAQQQHMQSIGNNLMVSQNNNLLGFSQSEMACMSDIFAYLQNDNAMPQMFLTCDMIGQENIFTPPLENGGYKVSQVDSSHKITEQRHVEIHKKLESERKNQDTIFQKSIDDFRKNYTGN